MPLCLAFWSFALSSDFLTRIEYIFWKWNAQQGTRLVALEASQKNQMFACCGPASALEIMQMDKLYLRICKAVQNLKSSNIR